MQTDCLALAKIVQNKKLGTLRLLVTFDTTAGKVTVLNAAYKSGDFCNIGNANTQVYVEKELARAREVLRTNNIVFA